MASSAILSVRIVGDAANALAEFGRVQDSTARMQSALNGASLVAGAALGGITAAALAAGDAASEAEQASGAVLSVFGDAADGVYQLAEAAADAVGLSESSYNQLASVLGAQMSNMGVASDDLAGQTDSLITLGADLAATFGGTTADAVGALSSLLRGERDPIERYGVSINQAAIDAQLAEMGLAGLTGEAARNAQMQATLALLTEQTSAAQGQFARESDTAAGAQERANAQWENAQIALGEQLLPIMTAAATELAGLATWVGQNTELVTGLAIGFGAVAAAIIIVNGAMRAYAAIQGIMTLATKAQTVAQGIATAAQWAFNVAASANPVVLIVLAIIVAIGLVVAAIMWLWSNWDAVTAWIGDAIDNIVAWWNGFVEDLGINDVIDGIGAGFDAAADWVGDAVDGMIGWVSDLVGWIQDAVGWLGSLIGLNNDAASSASSAQSAQQRAQPQTFAMARFAMAPSLMRAASEPTMTTTAMQPQAKAMAAGLAERLAARKQPASTTINVTVNGALDPNAVGAQVRQVLDRYDAVRGVS